VYRYVVLVHILGAAVWSGGHLLLALRILPQALRERSASMILDFEQRFEPLGITALIAQVLTGLWLAQHLVPPRMWFSLNFPASQMITAKLIFLAITIGLAAYARVRVIPRLSDENVGSMVLPITAVTTLGVLLIAAGVGIRTGGWQ
jgi:putative copper export protein